MEAIRKKALVIGATGLVGSALVRQLTDDPAYGEVVLLHRRHTGFKHSKIREVIVDFDRLDLAREEIKGDVLFSTLGTTLKKAGSKEAQYKVDYTYQLETAKIAAENGVSQLVLVSSAGADSKSGIFYSRVKGELEEAVIKLPFKQIVILRPSILAGVRKEFRIGERIGLIVMNALKWIPGIRKYRPIKDEIVAAAMRKSIAKSYERVTVYELEEVFSAAGY